LCTEVTSFLGLVRAISNASRATRADPVRVMTREAIVISSFGLNSALPVT
jgi:hypothetical protein